MLVWDMGATEVLVQNHKAQYASFTKIKDNEAQISAFQRQISTKMVQIEQFQSKFYKSLKSVDAILKTGKDVIYAKDIAKDIKRYQDQMLSIVKDDPKLSIVAVKTELELINRTADLFSYIYQVAIVGTDVNLMDNKQRLDLLKYVINELRNMRGLAYSVYRQLKTARRYGILQALSPKYFKYNVDSRKIAEDVLKEYKVKPKNR